MNKFLILTIQPNLIKLSILSVDKRIITEENIPIPQTFIYEDSSLIEQSGIFPFFLLQEKYTEEEEPQFECFNTKQLEHLVLYQKKYPQLLAVSLEELLTETEYSDEQSSVFQFLWKQLSVALDQCYYPYRHLVYDAFIVLYPHKYQGGYHFNQLLSSLKSKYHISPSYVDEIDADVAEALYHLEGKQGAYPFKKKEGYQSFVAVDTTEGHLLTVLYQLVGKQNSQGQFKFYIQKKQRIELENIGSQRLDQLLCQLLKDCFEEQYAGFLKTINEEGKQKLFREILQLSTISILPIKQYIKQQSQALKAITHSYALSLNYPFQLSEHLVSTYHLEINQFIIRCSLSRLLECYQDFMLTCVLEIKEQLFLQRKLEVDQLFFVGSDVTLVPVSLIKEEIEGSLLMSHSMAIDLSLPFMPMLIDDRWMKRELKNLSMGALLFESYLSQSNPLGQWDKHILLHPIISHEDWVSIERKQELPKEKKKFVSPPNGIEFSNKIKGLDLLTAYKTKLESEDNLADDTQAPIEISIIKQSSHSATLSSDPQPVTAAAINREPTSLLDNQQHLLLNNQAFNTTIKSEKLINQSEDQLQSITTYTTLPVSELSATALLDRLIDKVMQDPILIDRFRHAIVPIESILTYLQAFPSLLQELVEDPSRLLSAIPRDQSYLKPQVPHLLLIDGDQLSSSQIEALIAYAKSTIGPIVKGVVIKNKWPDFIHQQSGIHYKMVHLGSNSADHALYCEARRMIEDFSSEIAITIASNDSDLLDILHLDRHRQYFWIPYSQVPQKVTQTLKHYQATLLPAFQSLDF